MNDQTTDSGSETAPQPPVPPQYVALEKLAQEILKEQRISRRWRNIFRFVGVGVALFAVWAAFDFKGASKQDNARHTALVEIDGEIDSSSANASVNSILPALGEAFSDPGSVGVILRMNSPGGSPVQSAIVNDEITRLKKMYPKKPVYVVVEDMCASVSYTHLTLPTNREV